MPEFAFTELLPIDHRHPGTAWRLITSDGVELSVGLFLATTSSAEETRFREEFTCEVLHQAGALGVAPGSPRAPGALGERRPRAA